VKPLAERRGALPKSSSFDAGVIPESGQRLYLAFQTSWKEAGYFTVNLVVVDRGRQMSIQTLLGSNARKAGERLDHGAHRIGDFLAHKRHDKWWHLLDVQGGASADDPEFRRNLRQRLHDGNWTAATYEDEAQVIEAAVADVTRDVRSALKAIGLPE
jgi:hypothetical protein